ncbi:MAG: penicillin acylase family protein [Anaerolineae bacterium]|nr:penicillin acylase family protein [Anaerolineae bacterium]
MHLSGLENSVDILIDRAGVPHIYARSTPDLLFAQGYVQAP